MRSARRFTKLWTIQPREVWEQVQKNGSATVDPEHPKYEGEVPPAYRWLAEQMKLRLPEFDSELPWWAYCKKPHHRRVGKQEVRIELEPGEGSFLTFPCWAWNEVFSRRYLAENGDQYHDWLRRLRDARHTEYDDWPVRPPFHDELVASWSRLFSPNLPRVNWDPEGDRHECWEAAVGVLRLEDVRDVTHFIGAKE